MSAAGQPRRPTIPEGRPSTASQISLPWSHGGSSFSSPGSLEPSILTRCEASQRLGSVSNEALIPPNRINVATRISYRSPLADLQFEEETDPEHDKAPKWKTFLKRVAFYLDWELLLNRVAFYLNWEPFLKPVAFYLICWICFVNGFATGFGNIWAKAQIDDWGIDASDWASIMMVSLPAPMHGIGSCFAAPFVQRFGSLPVILLSSIVTLITSAFRAFGANTWVQCVSFRAAEGFFGSWATLVGIQAAREMYEPRLWVTNIGVWATAITLGPAAGSLVSASIDKNWRIGFICLTGAHALNLIVVVTLLQEIRCDPVTGTGDTPHPKGWLKRRYEGLLGITGYRRSDGIALWDSTKGLAFMLWRPQFCVPALIHVLVWNVVSASGDTTVHTLFRQDKDGYRLTSREAGLIYLPPLVGLLIAQLWGDLSNRCRQRRIFAKYPWILPETVLNECYFPIVVGKFGFLTWSRLYKDHHHWAGLLLCWGFIVIAALNTFVSITAYTFYCFPTHAVAASALLSFFREIVGFTGKLYAPDWISKMGLFKCFAVQGTTFILCYLLAIAVRCYGKSWRHKFHWGKELKIVKAEEADGLARSV